MARAYGAQVAKTLKRRINELTLVDEMDQLLAGPGKWHPMRADRTGEWAAWLTGNWRLVVEPDGEGEPGVLVVTVEDYHHR